MTYAEFKDYIITHLWKTGDSVVVDRLDTIIETAEHELNRTLKIEDRTQLSTAQAADNLVTLPTDYREMRVLSNPHCREMKYYIPAKFFVMRNSGEVNYEAYTITNRTILLLGAMTVTSPLTLTMLYYMNIPKFKALNSSWLADYYLDVYAYCVLKHSAPFLREDERLATWISLFNEAFATAMSENDDRKFAGSPLKIHMPSGIR